MNITTLLRRLGTPLGGCVMLLVLWLPWADIRCGNINTHPNLWQLAEYEWKLYFYAVCGALIFVLGAVHLWRRQRGWAWGSLAVVLIAAAGWLYLGLRHDEIIRRQIEMQQLGGDLEVWLKRLELDVGRGYWLYGVGMALAFLTAIWDAVSSRSRTDSQA